MTISALVGIVTETHTHTSEGHENGVTSASCVGEVVSQRPSPGEVKGSHLFSRNTRRNKRPRDGAWRGEFGSGSSQTASPFVVVDCGARHIMYRDAEFSLAETT